jgi:predicted PurR-regulated permease PerM
MDDGRDDLPDDVFAARDASGVVRLRFTTRSLIGSVAALAVTLIVIRAFTRASHTLAWVLAAVIIGALLLPIVTVLATRMPRGLAILIVGVLTLVALGAVVFMGFDDLNTEAKRAERALPRAAAQLEESDEFSEFAEAFDLEDRARRFSDELPEQLRGRVGLRGVRSATSTGAAFLVIVVLTLFTLIYAPRFFESALAQIDDPDRRDRVESTLRRGYRRGWTYLALHLIKAIVAGVLTVVVCSLADVPAPVVLGIWVGIWSFVPDVGIVVAALPIVMLAVLTSFTAAAVLLVLFVTYQILEGIYGQRWIEDRTVHVGPALTFLVGLVGFEIYGFGGTVMAVILLVFAVAVADEIAPDDDAELVGGTREVLDGAGAAAG